MNTVRKFLVVAGAFVVSACAVAETAPRFGPTGLIDAGITGNPEIARSESASGAGRTVVVASDNIVLRQSAST